MNETSDIEELYTIEEKRIISSLLLRFLQYKKTCELYSYENIDFFNDIFWEKSAKQLLIDKEEFYKTIDNQVIYLVRNKKNKMYVNRLVEELSNNNSIVVVNDIDVNELGYRLPITESKKSISLYGPFFDFKKMNISDSFKILAIIHVFNEADVIEQTTDYLLSQGIDVFLVDNWSTDDSYKIIQSLSEKYPENVFCKRFPEDGPTDFYDWYHQLELTEMISRETDYSWYIHYDADEYRISPWANATLREAIYYIDSLGFNVIENTVIDFKITEKTGDSIFMKDTWFDFGHRPAHFEQTKTWKKCDCIDLKNSGGHIAKVSNPKVFPLKILNRHYPLRSYEHAQQKIFADRKPRFELENKKRGWHGHYNMVQSAEDVVVGTEKLYFWDNSTFREMYIPLFTGCGVEVEKEEKVINIRSLHIDDGEAIILYGAGKIGKALYESLSGHYQIEAWVDKAYEFIQPMYGRCIQDINVLTKTGSKIVIAIENEDVAAGVVKDLLEMGISKRRIIWEKEIFEK